MKAPFLSQADLKRMLTYDSETGIFTWKVRSDVRAQWNGRYAGKRAGYEWMASGGGHYRSVRIYDYPFPEHRLAWLYMTGAWPAEVVDHIDRIGTHNAWKNLREATRSQNSANAAAWKNNKLGVRGVSAQGNRFRATIYLDRHQTCLGTFRSIDEASEAYKRAAIRAKGEFAGGSL